jgi:hypothetical protein
MILIRATFNNRQEYAVISHRNLYRAAGVLALCCASSATAQVDLLPDIVYDVSTLYLNEIDTTARPGRVLLRFEGLYPNAGPGEFRLEATGEDAGNGRQRVVQRVYRDDGTSYTRPTAFLYAPHLGDKMEITGWADYYIREILPDDGVGEVLREGAKTLVGITSSVAVDFGMPLPNMPPPGAQFVRNGGNHGISVGYGDLYPRHLDDQWIDITGLPAGEYWLEVEMDRLDHVLEADDTNNSARIKIALPSSILDSDGDGLNDDAEEVFGTNPDDADSDDDGLSDFDEVAYDGDDTAYNPYHPETNPSGTDLDASSRDTDGDHYSDLTEINFGHDPLNPEDPGAGGLFCAAGGVSTWRNLAGDLVIAGLSLLVLLWRSFRLPTGRRA